MPKLYIRSWLYKEAYSIKPWKVERIHTYLVVQGICPITNFILSTAQWLEICSCVLDLGAWASGQCSLCRKRFEQCSTGQLHEDPVLSLLELLSFEEQHGLNIPIYSPFLQDESTSEITFYMKGADAVMSTIVQYNDWLEEEVTSTLSWERVHRLASRRKTSVLSQLVDLGLGMNYHARFQTQHSIFQDSVSHWITSGDTSSVPWGCLVMSSFLYLCTTSVLGFAWRYVRHTSRSCEEYFVYWWKSRKFWNNNVHIANLIYSFLT